MGPIVGNRFSGDCKCIAARPEEDWGRGRGRGLVNVNTTAVAPDPQLVGCGGEGGGCAAFEGTRNVLSRKEFCRPPTLRSRGKPRRRTLACAQ